MKGFFKSIFGSCLGTLLALVILVCGSLLVISLSQNNKIKKGAILHLDFNHLIPELTDNVSSQQSFQQSNSAAPGLRRIKKLIKHAASDPNIEGILIEPTQTSVSFTKSLEILNSLEEFKTSEKFVYAYSDYYTQSGYLLSSIADSIFLNPNGGVQIKGFGVTVMYFKELMDRLGIQMNIFYAGNFKSGSEPYRLNKMSANNREQTDEYLQHLEQILRETIFTQRGITGEELEEYMAKNEIFSARAALDSKLTDRLTYWDECLESLSKAQNVSTEKLSFVPFTEYHEKVKLKSTKKGDKIAIVFAEGNIFQGSGANGAIYSKDMNRILRKIKNDSEVKAVVLRVNSPGGDGHASDNIHREISRISVDGIPVVTSMGTYAASGGYYIAAPSDYIFAEPSTLTGSIGVYAMLPEFDELLENKIGLHFDSVKTSPNAISFDPFFGISENEKTQLEKSTQAVYKRFLEVVSSGRNMKIDEVKAVADGKIWSADDALAHGLIDEIGSLENAISKAAELAGIETYQLAEFPTIEKSFIEGIASQVLSETASDPLTKIFFEEKNRLGYILEFAQAKSPLTRLPIYVNYSF